MLIQSLFYSWVFFFPIIVSAVVFGPMWSSQDDVLFQERSVELLALPSDQGGLLFDQLAFPSDEGVFSYDQAALPVDQGALSFEQANIPVDQGALPFEQAALPLYEGALSSDQPAFPVDQGEPSFDMATWPGVEGAISFDLLALPSDQGALSFEQAALPVDQGGPEFDQLALPLDQMTSSSGLFMLSEESYSPDESYLAGELEPLWDAENIVPPLDDTIPADAFELADCSAAEYFPIVGKPRVRRLDDSSSCKNPDTAPPIGSAENLPNGDETFSRGAKEPINVPEPFWELIYDPSTFERLFRNRQDNEHCYKWTSGMYPVGLCHSGVPWDSQHFGQTVDLYGAWFFVYYLNHCTLGMLIEV
jgi:hypothetical protein